FLALDFDKTTWIEDVGAFAETCRLVGLPAAIERSRSGNGAHVWFFFSSPVPAAAARKMGCYLITETMSRRHELSMESYDRFFPSQDTMPRGGFGNLIALPLQREPRALGNSVFLDPQLRPYADDQAPGGRSESRVRQEAAHASLAGHDAESHHMCRRSTSICCSAARLPGRARGAAARPWSFPRGRRSARRRPTTSVTVSRNIDKP